MYKQMLPLIFSFDIHLATTYTHILVLNIISFNIDTKIMASIS